MAPRGNLVPSTEVKPRWGGVRIEKDRLVLTAEFIDRGEGAPYPLLARARTPAIVVLGSEDPGLVADGAAEELQRLEVALTWQQDPRPAVVPDRPRRLRAVAGLDL